MNNTPYDELANEYYDAYHKTCRNFDQTTLPALQDLRARVPSSGLILDIGAGRGRCNEFLGIEPRRVIQLDNSRRMLELQPREQCLIRILHDAQCLPFPDSQFCCITAFLCDPFLGLSFLREVCRVLSPGGLFIGTTPSYEWGAALREQLHLNTSMTRFITKARTQVLVPSILVPVNRLIEMLTVAGFAQNRVQVRRHRLPLESSLISQDIVLPAQIIGLSVHDLDILYSVIAEK